MECVKVFFNKNLSEFHVQIIFVKEKLSFDIILHRKCDNFFLFFVFLRDMAIEMEVIEQHREIMNA